MVDYAHFLSHVARGGQVSAIRRLGQMAVPAGTISFTSGYPDPATYPWEEFRQITADLLASHDASVLQYGPTRGCRDLLEGLIDILAGRGIRATIGDLLVTTGSQQGIDLVGRAMIDPGDVVLFELPAYPGATAAFRNLQANLAGVKQEADGIDLDDLDAVMLRERCAGHRVRLLYVVPNFQNPTGLILSRSKRQRLLEWASRRDVVVLEDDPYGELYFDGSAGPADTRPIKADDAEGRVV
jgi:2-aminoadipate transaminase